MYHSLQTENNNKCAVDLYRFSHFTVHLSKKNIKLKYHNSENLRHLNTFFFNLEDNDMPSLFQKKEITDHNSKIRDKTIDVPIHPRKILTPKIIKLQILTP